MKALVVAPAGLNDCTVAVAGAKPLTDDELNVLCPLLMQHPNSSDQSLLATIDALKGHVKYLRIVRP